VEAEVGHHLPQSVVAGPGADLLVQPFPLGRSGRCIKLIQAGRNPLVAANYPCRLDTILLIHLGIAIEELEIDAQGVLGTARLTQRLGQLDVEPECPFHPFQERTDLFGQFCELIEIGPQPVHEGLGQDLANPRCGARRHHPLQDLHRLGLLALARQEFRPLR
jgi:hypothetical protein